ncbi:MAG: hypothetical protein ACM3P1_06665 [Candidatus Saccharibacteria bacterium]
MKTQLFVLLLFIMALITLTGCEKDHDDSLPLLPVESVSINPSYENYSFSGEIDKVVYASLFGSILPGYKINLNNDSIDDIEFSCSVYRSINFEQWNASVKTLHENVKIDVQQDTLLFANYYIKHYNPSTKDSITVSYRENYDKTKQYPLNLSITKVIVGYPFVHSAGDILNEHKNWGSGNYSLEYYDNSSGVKTNIHGGGWRNIDRKYIGVRLSDKDALFYGWIELGVADFRITLYKYALQEIK